jgi:hypothetical protein
VLLKLWSKYKEWSREQTQNSAMNEAIRIYKWTSKGGGRSQPGRMGNVRRKFIFELREYRHRKNLYAIIRKERGIP